MDLSNLDDLTLWDKIVSGDERAFEYVYTNYSEDLYRYGQRLCKERTMIEDSIHDVFFYVWYRRKKLKVKDSIKFYLLKAFKWDLVKKMSQIQGGSNDRVPKKKIQEKV
ncbi:RNA polymerase sigma factor [Pleomorphovibrio marinus]|uniref:RNA polymerase sigma factor n=1 Tax=Pleomorphovibrio marinus TaxID=2164132 RepID=UPI000E09EDED|nr:hypothetical protein [Pleomorphovibrio marinus]